MLARLTAAARSLRARLTALRHPRRLDRELHEELRFHLERATEKNVRAGMSREAAAKAARRALGSPARLRDQHRDARGVRWLQDLALDLRHGLRRLADRPWITLATVLTLAIGIGSITTLYGAARALVLDPLPYPDVDEVVLVDEALPGRQPGGEGWAHGSDVEAWRDDAVFAAVGGARRWFVVMTGGEEPVDVIGYQLIGDYFRVLGIDAAIGRTPAPDAGIAGPSEAVLSHRFWRSHFGADPDVIGRVVRLHEREHVIVGVLPARAAYPMGTDLWVSTGGVPENPAVEARTNVAVLARLAPGVTLERARAALRVAAERASTTDPELHEGRVFRLQPIREVVTYGTTPMVGLLMGAAVFLMLLVCGNIANLQLTHAASRQREMAVRAAIGAGRGRLVRQLLAESTVLALVAGLVATAATFQGTGMLRAGMSGDWWRFFFVGVDRVRVDTDVLVFCLAISLVSVFLFGLAPALRASRVDPQRDLVQGSGGSRRAEPHGVLVVVEVALSILLVTGAWITASSAQRVGIADMGLGADVGSFAVRPRTATYREPERLRMLTDDALRIARTTPGVIAAAATNQLPGLPPGRGLELVAEDTEVTVPAAHLRVVSDGFFDTVGVALQEGRDFTSRDDDAAEPVAILARAVAERLWPGQAAVRRRVRLDGEEVTRTVVGVADDVARAWHDLEPMAALYVPAAQQTPRATVLLLRGDAASVELARQRLWERYPDVPLPASQSLSATIAERAAPARLVSRLLASFAVVAFLVSVGGVHALVSSVVSLRLREVGVHMALGAAPGMVSRLFVRRGVLLATVGAVIGLPSAWVAATFLSRMISRIDDTGFIDIGAAGAWIPMLGLAVVAVAALASYVPARRAARTDPATVLRCD